MTSDEKRAQAASALLAVNETRPDRASHLEILDPEKCKACEKPCIVVCPAHTYTWSGERDALVVNFDNCLECGTCRAVCPYSAIGWKNPIGGAGVCYRYG